MRAEPTVIEANVILLRGGSMFVVFEKWKVVCFGRLNVECVIL